MIINFKHKKRVFPLTLIACSAAELAFQPKVAMATACVGPEITNNCDAGLGIASSGNYSVASGVTLTNTNGGNAVEVMGASTSIQFINNGTITGTGDNAGFIIINSASVSTFTNAGTLQGASDAIYTTGTIGALVNSGTITDTGDVAIWSNGSSIGSISNTSTGTIIGRSGAIYHDGSNTIGSITNFGTMAESGINGYGVIYNDTGATITTIYNGGSLNPMAGSYGIVNSGALGRLDNAQASLTYSGNLPSAYNVAVTSSGFGGLAVIAPSGLMTAGISSYSSAARTSTMAGIISGVTSANLSNAGETITYTYGNTTYSFILSDANNDTLWDLVYLGASSSGPSAEDTQAALLATSKALRGTFSLQTASLVGNLGLDCTVFSARGICVAAGANYRRSIADGDNATSGLLVAGYRLSDRVRIGAWVDQNSLPNASTTVTSGTRNPMLGVYGVWAEDTEASGLSVRAAAGYGNKDLTVTRSMVGSSEAGSGNSTLTSRGASIVASYAIQTAKGITATPYLGARYASIEARGYTEAATSGVTGPLSIDALLQASMSAVAGLKLSSQIAERLQVSASAGIEHDVNNRGNVYNASGMSGLTALSFKDNIQKTRANASLGALLSLAKGQVLSVQMTYRDEAFSRVSTTSAQVMYQAAF